MKKIVSIYTIPVCPYCTQAKSLLTQQNIPFEEIKVDRHNEQAINELIARSGMRTFPQIFHGDDLIGGYSELRALYQEKGLKHLLD